MFEHFHTAKTIRSPTVRRLVPEMYVEVNADDAARWGVKDGEWVRIVTPRIDPETGENCFYEARVSIGTNSKVRPARNLDAGAVRLNEAYLAEPVTHRVNNIGTDTVRSVLILNERVTNRNPQVNVRESLPGIPEIDGTWFSQSRIILESGQVLNWDGVDAGVAFVLVSDSHVTLGLPGTSELYGLTSLRSVIYVNGDHGYRFENHGKEPATIIAVALL